MDRVRKSELEVTEARSFKSAQEFLFGLGICIRGLSIAHDTKSNSDWLSEEEKSRGHSSFKQRWIQSTNNVLENPVPFNHIVLPSARLPSFPSSYGRPWNFWVVKWLQ